MISFKVGDKVKINEANGSYGLVHHIRDDGPFAAKPRYYVMFQYGLDARNEQVTALSGLLDAEALVSVCNGEWWENVVEYRFNSGGADRAAKWDEWRGRVARAAGRIAFGSVYDDAATPELREAATTCRLNPSPQNAEELLKAIEAAEKTNGVSENATKLFTAFREARPLPTSDVKAPPPEQPPTPVPPPMEKVSIDDLIGEDAALRDAFAAALGLVGPMLVNFSIIAQEAVDSPTRITRRAMRRRRAIDPAMLRMMRAAVAAFASFTESAKPKPGGEQAAAEGAAALKKLLATIDAKLGNAS